MPSLNTYRLTWVSLTLDEEYLLTAAPPDLADDTILMAESEEELKSFLMKVKEESETGALKLNIQKTKIMPSDPITS